MSENIIDRDAIIRVFLAEADENLLAMEQSLVALETASDDGEIVHTIFRAAHTLKGNAMSVGFDTVVELAHVAEDLLDELRAERFTVTPGLITLLLRCVDSMKTLVQGTAEQPDDPPKADPLLVEAMRNALLTGEYHETAGSRSGGAAARGARNDTLRVSLAKLDDMLNLAGEIAIARGRLRAVIDQTGNASREIGEAQEFLDRLCDDLQGQVMGVRMVPLEPVFQQQVRVARDMTHGGEKTVQVRFEGEDVELDTAVVERVRDPLVHMVRNAVDHGLETREERLREGKPAAGTILLRAHYDGGMVVIQVIDDGAGLDTERITARARAVGLVGPRETPSPEQLHSFLFMPGFTTAEMVTEISGRGVGMDVVQRNIHSLRGTISVDSTPGKGTTFTVRLPLTLAIIDALSVGVGEQTYVVPLDGVTECIDVAEHQLQEKATGVLDVRGEAVPFIRLASCLGVESAVLARRSLLLVRDGTRRVGVVVDQLHNRTQAVIKPLWKPLPRMDAVAGATILGNGDVALILDLPRLLRQQQLKEAV